MPNDTDTLLRAMLCTIGRSAFTVRQVYDLVNPKGRGAKQIKAYNLADGSKTQAQILSATKLDQGNFSRTVTRWIESGIMFRLGEGRESRLLHIFPIPSKPPKE